MKDITFYLAGPIPSKKNSKQIRKRRDGKRFISSSNRYHEWNEREKQKLIFNRLSNPHAFPISLSKEIYITVYFGDKRKRDLTNTAESVMDTLVDAGIIIDDNWMTTGAIKLIPAFDKEKPRAEVRIFVDAFEEAVNAGNVSRNSQEALAV
jgi:Holliday junction resolvase RusA-like endonuclease